MGPLKFHFALAALAPCNNRTAITAEWIRDGGNTLSLYRVGANGFVVFGGNCDVKNRREYNGADILNRDRIVIYTAVNRYINYSNLV